MSYSLLGKLTHGIHFVQVIYKVALAQVHGELRMSRVTGKIGEDGGKPPEPSKMAALSWGPPGWVIMGVGVGFPWCYWKVRVAVSRLSKAFI